ncbi:hemerythrin domain-containing protein [Streptomyces sp. VRA16 Mangrove soil]|uniref:hemerythrin domain-containing protein n=1 Tax=Streptomyces sp. VRA16 Mangrove soil TaxID=2817434 RepID=UPI001A9FDF06|nr:hemerythrin domain-containing protein [Streptomyces sp. VRA16 Mangrove soil]MBO1332984.1 hemerythrin domain-containing protein [Streptomyces sp. VRA16 Mangrove soil]
MTSNDVVELLEQQHVRIRTLFEEVANTKGEERGRHFHELVRLLAVHETAEEEVVHPFARKNIDGGELVVKDRLEEEESAKKVLAQLDDMDPDSAEFLDRFAALRQDVLAHAEKEEHYEFAHFKEVADQGKLANLARAVRAAEAVAPTRPHPGTDTATKNLVTTPVATVVDHARDAIRKVMGT